MKTLDSLPLEALRELARDLQAKVDRFIVVRQQLIDTRGQLDRELARFKVIQACNEQLLEVGSFEEFTSSLLESVLEAFEFEGSIFLQLNEETGRLDVIDQVGFDELPESIDFDPDCAGQESGLILDSGHPLLEKWAELNLAQAIICPFFDQRGDLLGLILGGHTNENKGYYDAIKAEVVTSFSVMVAQAGSLLGNYELKRRIQEKNVQLEQYSKNLESTVAQRTAELQRANKDLDVANQFIRKTFGRYLSDDIVETILEAPDGTVLSGEKRRITLMMSDLRGFTALSERLPAEAVLEIINIYLGAMTEIILAHNGTIDEFLGDSIFALFGAPILHEDDPLQAVACALEMQLAMAEVNERCRQRGYPELAQGIGINTGEVIVGNIGSLKRSKYGVVGRPVNLTARIESHTVGGQILISENTRQACGDVLRIDGCQEIIAKGLQHPLMIYEVGGIAAQYDIFLPEKSDVAWVEPRRPLSVRFAIIDGTNVQRQEHVGELLRFGDKVAELRADAVLTKSTNLKLTLLDDDGVPITSDVFAKLTARMSPPTAGASGSYRICFTYVPPEASALLQSKAGCVCRGGK